MNTAGLGMSPDRRLHDLPGQLVSIFCHLDIKELLSYAGLEFLMLVLNFLCFRKFRTFEERPEKKKIKISFSCCNLNLRFAHHWHDEQLQSIFKMYNNWEKFREEQD